MPELTPTGAVDVVRRQVGRVRRRKNFYELQRALYLIVALAAAGATVLLPVALFASAEAFTVTGWSALAILGGLGIVVVGGTRRRWLARAQALAWIENHGALGGRVRTLVELAGRPATTPGFFQPLLVEQIRRDLDTWKPRRLVRRAVPRGALAGALVAAVVLAAALRLASLALPSAPAIGMSAQAVGGGTSDPATRHQPEPGERIVVAPGVPGSGSNPAPAMDTRDAADDDSAMTQLSSALQETVRRQVWGKAWERVRDALARSTSGRGATETDGGRNDADDELATETDDSEIASGPSGERRRRRPGIGRQPAAQSADPAKPDDTDAASTAAAEQHDSAEGGSGGGAGNGAGPDLFGGPPVDAGEGEGSFELSLAARMRSDRTGGRAGSGPPPDAAPDARPALASEQRRESAAHRMTVPAAYETVVREVFAHRERP